MTNITLRLWPPALVLFSYFSSDLDKRGLLSRIADRNDVPLKAEGK